MVVAFVAIALHGLPWRMDRRVTEILAYQGYDYHAMFREGRCFLRPDQPASDLDLGICAPTNAPTVILWGDSSIAQYYWGLSPLIQKRGFVLGQLTSSACPPILDYSVPTRPNCRAFNDLAFNAIIAARPERVILGASWPTAPADLEMLDRTVSKLEQAGLRVVVLGPPAFYKRPVPVILADRFKSGNRSIESGDDLDANVSVHGDDAMRAHFAPGTTRYVSIRSAICGADCAIAIDGVPMHFDLMHLTRQGSDYYAPRLMSAIFKN
jgi:hypothetical protein